jgi:phthiocerol/phenolphthiocerol synthesis type-I polyketide synthase C
VLTQAGAISHIPSGISFEAAATIPSTFFTVYYACTIWRACNPKKRC